MSITSRFVVLTVALLAAGCATRADSPAIEQTRLQLGEVARDGNVSGTAAVPLREAETALANAQRAADAGDAQARDHWLYIAQRKLELARAVGAENAAVARREALAREREQVRLDASQQQASQAERQVEMLRGQVEELQARRTDHGTVIASYPLPFATGSAVLQPGADIRLQPLVRYLRDNPNQRVEIAGFTDAVGDESFNLELSQRRAEAVRGYLLSQGISPEQVVARGFGESFPVAANDSEAGRQQNRRVEVLLAETPR